MNKRYWLNDERLAVIFTYIRQADPPFFDGFEVCDLLKQIECVQLIEATMEKKCNQRLVEELSKAHKKIKELNKAGKEYQGALREARKQIRNPSLEQGDDG